MQWFGCEVSGMSTESSGIPASLTHGSPLTESFSGVLFLMRLHVLEILKSVTWPGRSLPGQALHNRRTQASTGEGEHSMKRKTWSCV